MTSELQERARCYAGILRPGDTIDDATDGAYTAPFWFYLPVALHGHGLRLKRQAHGYVVEVRS